MRIFLLLIAFFSVTATANDSVWVHKVNQPVDAIYGPIYKSLEEAKFYVVFEPNIGKSISGFSERWGNEYNRNELTQIRSMVFCNGWYANKVSNVDPDMLGFCPLHLSLIEQEGKTTVLFNRPSIMAKNSPAKNIFESIEAEVIAAIKQGLE